MILKRNSGNKTGKPQNIGWGKGINFFEGKGARKSRMGEKKKKTTTSLMF